MKEEQSNKTSSFFHHFIVLNSEYIKNKGLKMFLKKVSILILLGLVIFTGCTTSKAPKAPQTIEKGDYSYVKKYMRWYIKEQMQERDIVGLSVALVDDQKIVWQEGFGYEDRAKSLKATPQTRYRAGSITKLINALAVMKLREEGKMDIDKPLKTYLPEFAIKSRFGSTDEITPRNIMTHHSGLLGDWMDRMYSTNPLHYTDYLKLIKDEYVAYPPNKILSYSNLGITLLGHAVEQTAQTSYAKFINTSLFEPMTMNNSYIKTALEGEGASKSYADEKLKDEYPMGKLPAGGLNSSVNDLSHLAMMMNGGGKFKNQTVLEKSSLDEMFKVQNESVALDLGDKTGLGLFMYDKLFGGADRVYHHGGDIGSHHSFFLLSKKSKLGVVVMTNTNSASAWMIAKEMVEKAWESKTGQKIPKDKKEVSRLEKSSELEGTYASMLGKVDIIKKSEGVYITEIMGDTIRLKRGEDNRYHAKYMLFGLIPIGDEQLDNLALYTKEIDGKIVLINDNSLMGVKVEPKPISKAWKERLGTYHIINQLEPKGTQIEKVVAKIEDAFPLLEVNMKSGETLKYILEIVNDDEAIIEGIGRGMRETIRVEDGVFYYMGLGFKRI